MIGYITNTCWDGCRSSEKSCSCFDRRSFSPGSIYQPGLKMKSCPDLLAINTHHEEEMKNKSTTTAEREDRGLLYARVSQRCHWAVTYDIFEGLGIEILQFIDRIQIIRIPCIRPMVHLICSHTRANVGMYAGETVCFVPLYKSSSASTIYKAF